MAVKIRMKKMGRRHRPFFRICAMDGRVPRDGRVIEELGHYDPMVRDTDARITLNRERVAYWVGVGAQPTPKVAVLIRKYGEGGTHVSENEAALARLAEERKHRGPPAGFQPAVIKSAPKAEEPAAEAPADAEAAAEPVAEAPAEETPAAEAEAAAETPAE
ncbi:MAG: 30S ribosomal protein S16 [Planctomycetales bacterium]|nr:30S ribosomal protein S16 [Planctomycetales bacterium]